MSLSSKIRYDTIGDFNVDSKADYTAKSSPRSQKLKQTKPVPSIQVSKVARSTAVRACQHKPDISISLEKQMQNRWEMRSDSEVDGTIDR